MITVPSSLSHDILDVRFQLYAFLVKYNALWIPIEISTTARPGSSILTVQATDADVSPQFNTVCYCLPNLLMSP